MRHAAGVALTINVGCQCPFLKAGIRDPSGKAGVRRPELSCVGPPCSVGGPLFHKAKGAAPFHSIEGVDDLISIEDPDEPVHCMRSV